MKLATANSGTTRGTLDWSILGPPSRPACFLNLDTEGAGVPDLTGAAASVFFSPSGVAVCPGPRLWALSPTACVFFLRERGGSPAAKFFSKLFVSYFEASGDTVSCSAGSSNRA